MRTPNAYTVLGWVVWQVGARVARRKMVRNRVKLGAAGVVAGVVAAGVVAARATSDSDS